MTVFVDQTNQTIERVESGTKFLSTQFPEHDNKELKFLGWNYKEDGNGEFFKADTIINHDIVVYVIYEKEAVKQLPSTGINNLGAMSGMMVCLAGSILVLRSKKDKGLVQ